MMSKMGDSAVARRRSGWDKVASWAGIGNNREGHIRMKGEAIMQDEAVTQTNGEQKSEELENGTRTVPEIGQERGQERGPEAARDSYAQSGPGSQDGVAQQEIAQLRGEKDQLIDRLARLQAEFDNARKRDVRERADAREYTIGSTVEPFLGVMDNFQLALKSPG